LSSGDSLSTPVTVSSFILAFLLLDCGVGAGVMTSFKETLMEESAKKKYPQTAYILRFCGLACTFELLSGSDFICLPNVFVLSSSEPLCVGFASVVN